MLKTKAELAPGAYADSTHATLVQAIEYLLRLLAEPSPDEPATSTKSDPPTHFWEDEEYSYLETEIESAGHSICDISVADGKVFIRVVKSDLTDEEGEHLPRLATIASSVSQNGS